MYVVPQVIEGVFLVKNFVAEDNRGFFVKTFNEEIFAKLGMQTQYKESYYSLSHKDVIRGMHFQQPPFDHEKLVYVTNGEILDVVLDIRKASKTYGKYISVSLKENSDSIYIPRGCAHGFLTISNSATVVYNVSTTYQPSADAGIRWDSFGFDWLGVVNPIISKRDQEFSILELFKSQF